MKRKQILKQRITTNKYGSEKRQALEKWYKITESGREFDVEYIVQDCYTDSGTGYFRTYKRLGNAMKDSVVEKLYEEIGADEI